MELKKIIHVQVWRSHEGSRRLRHPDFNTIRQMKVVSLSTLRTGHLYHHEIFQVLISVTGWVKPRTLVWPEGLYQWKIPIAPSGIKPFRLVKRFLNKLRYCMLHIIDAVIWSTWYPIVASTKLWFPRRNYSIHRSLLGGCEMCIEHCGRQF
jgi:hypothetical protein